MMHSPDPKDKESYGQELILNLYGCDLKTISSRVKIKKFCKKYFGAKSVKARLIKRP